MERSASRKRTEVEKPVNLMDREAALLKQAIEEGTMDNKFLDPTDVTEVDNDNSSTSA